MKYEVVIIGAGIIGAATAFELSKRGYRTLNVDRLPAAGYGPTSNSCAIVRSHYSTPDGVLMAHESYFHWKDWERYLEVADELGPARFGDSGILVLKSATGHYKKAVRHYRRLGVQYEDWDLATLKRRCPFYDTHSYYPPKRPEDAGFYSEPQGELEGAIYSPQGGYVVDPQLATHNLQRAAEAKGAAFLFREEVAEIRTRRDRVSGVTLTDGREIDADVVVNVAGPHSGAINHLAGVTFDMRVRTRALRHEVHVVPAPDGSAFGEKGITTSDGDLGIYFRPEGESQILVGSEDPSCDQREWVDDPNVFKPHVTEAQCQAQVYRLARRIPSLPIPTIRRGIVDLYDVSDDWIPIYDKSSLRGFYMAIGSSGNQFKRAPVAGQIMAELIDHVEGGCDHDSEPVQLRCRYTALTLDCGFFSRLRAMNQSSSFSVAG